ncbi:unnamed protein product, partial [Symbiodinium sp. KB8]
NRRQFPDGKRMEEAGCSATAATALARRSRAAMVHLARCVALTTIIATVILEGPRSAGAEPFPGLRLGLEASPCNCGSVRGAAIPDVWRVGWQCPARLEPGPPCGAKAHKATHRAAATIPRVGQVHGRRQGSCCQGKVQARECSGSNRQGNSGARVIPDGGIRAGYGSGDGNEGARRIVWAGYRELCGAPWHGSGSGPRPEKSGRTGQLLIRCGLGCGASPYYWCGADARGQSCGTPFHTSPSPWRTSSYDPSCYYECSPQPGRRSEGCRSLSFPAEHSAVWDRDSSVESSTARAYAGGWPPGCCSAGTCAQQQRRHVRGTAQSASTGSQEGYGALWHPWKAEFPAAASPAWGFEDN